MIFCVKGDKQHWLQGEDAMRNDIGDAFLRNSGAKSISTLTQDDIETDILVIGGGMAGVFAAIKAKEKDLDVTLAVKGAVGSSGMTPFANTFMVSNLKPFGRIRVLRPDSPEKRKGLTKSTH